MGSPRPPVMVCDVDPLGPQGLDLYAKLVPRSLVATVLYAGCHFLRVVCDWLPQANCLCTSAFPHIARNDVHPWQLREHSGTGGGGGGSMVAVTGEQRGRSGKQPFDRGCTPYTSPVHIAMKSAVFPSDQLGP